MTAPAPHQPPDIGDAVLRLARALARQAARHDHDADRTAGHRGDDDGRSTKS